MRVFDRPLAGAGRLAAAIARRGRWAPWAAVFGLATLSLLPVLIVGSTAQPADISFEDLAAQRLPPMTSWFRVEGDLSAVSVEGGQYTYALREPGTGGLGVTIISDSPLQTGHAQVTGRLSGVMSVAGTFTTIRADVPTEPARHDPWLLFSLPALLAIPVLVGTRTGYPVVRRDPPPRSRGAPLGLDESLPARWSGRIGNDSASLEQMRPCTIAVASDGDVCRVRIDEAGTSRTVTTRRSAARKRERICWTHGCRPAVVIHGPSADLVLTLDNSADRDRLMASLG